MGRKDDDEDLSKESADTLNDGVNELANKCKPVNVQLSRIEVSSNGVSSEDSSKSCKTQEENLVQKELDKFVEEDMIENEDNDAAEAETIKKIKEFIAMGRCEMETKKDSSIQSKSVTCYPKPAVKRKFSEIKEQKKSPNKSSSLENLNLELDLTLEEKDDETEKSKEERKLPESLNALTPSRVSKRIQSKAVKFSVKKMLRGDDASVLKRIIPGYETEKKKERILSKVSSKKELNKTPLKELVKGNINPLKMTSPSKSGSSVGKDHSLPVDSTSPPASPSNEDSHRADASVHETTSEEDQNSVNKIKSIVENKGNIIGLSNTIQKLAVGNGKVTLELKGSQQKKVVRIAVPPQQRPSPKAALGPDIIIKRVKPFKKTTILPEKEKLTAESASLTSKANEEESEVRSCTSNILQIAPRINIERISTPKSIDEVVILKKNILKRFQTDKKQMKAIKKPIRRRGRRRVIVSPDDSEDDDLEESDASKSSPKADLEEEEPAKSAEVVVAVEKSPSPEPPVPIVPEPQEVYNSPPKEEKKEEKKRGRKPKAYHAQLAKQKEENPVSKAQQPPKNVENVATTTEKTTSSEDMDAASPTKTTYDNVFDSYFRTQERLVEHHDSLDSDSSADLDDDFYSHFINLRMNKGKAIPLPDTDIQDENEISIYDLMHDISMELPGWNIHIPSDGKTFCIAQIDIIDNVPHMKKAIEMDLDYNTKVYVDGTLLSEYTGVYNTYEDIQQLIYDVDVL